MAKSLFSPSWYRVDKLTPRLRDHVRIHRHHYRGVLWYVLEDPSSQRTHRFTPAVNYILGLMDGVRTVNQIWELATENLGDDAPTQDELIQLLGQLHSADAMQCDVPPDTKELLERHQKQKSSSWKRKYLNPLAVRIPLFDPDKFLVRSMMIARLAFSWFGAALWLFIVGWGIVLAALHWPELTVNVTDRVLAPSNLILLWLTFPIVKALHELGHAYAIRVWGGEVHEMGIMFLVLMPIPYVDASAASSFREKYKRVIVGSGGMIVEIFIATLAFFVWLQLEPGTARSIAYNVMLIASVSTVLFNANPLLRFDGYYIFADYVEIQNLGTRSTKYLGFLFQKYLFGLRNLEPALSTPGERRWFVGYGVASFIYRIFVVVLIVTFVATKFFFIGVIMALWATVIMVFIPIGKNIAKILTDSAIAPKRTRAITTTAFIILVLLIVVFLIPVPSWTRTQGVVWVQGDAVVRVETDGFIETIVAKPNAKVKRGNILIRLRDKEVETRVKLLRGRVEELDAQHTMHLQDDLVRARMLREEIASAKAELARAEDEFNNLILRSKMDGTFIIMDAEDLPGRYVRKGEVIAYTVDPKTTTTRVTVKQQDIDIVRNQTKTIEVRMVDRIFETQSAEIKRLVPGATDKLPSLALSQQGGGEIAVDPQATKQAKAFQKHFVLEVGFPINSPRINIGSRVYVRFDHGFESIGKQGYRRLRQLFMVRFNV